MKKDRLGHYIRKHLATDTERSQSFDELIVEAVGEYMAELMETGFIPGPQIDLVEEVLMEDSWDILRKITYGSLSLDAYRESQKRKSRKASC